MTYRSTEESLRADNERLTRELAAARAARPKRWVLPPEALGPLPVILTVWGLDAMAFIAWDLAPKVIRGTFVCMVITLLWVIAYARPRGGAP